MVNLSLGVPIKVSNQLIVKKTLIIRNSQSIVVTGQTESSSSNTRSN